MILALVVLTFRNVANHSVKVFHCHTCYALNSIAEFVSKLSFINFTK